MKIFHSNTLDGKAAASCILHYIRQDELFEVNLSVIGLKLFIDIAVDTIDKDEVVYIVGLPLYNKDTIDAILERTSNIIWFDNTNISASFLERYPEYKNLLSKIVVNVDKITTYNTYVELFKTPIIDPIIPKHIMIMNNMTNGYPDRETICFIIGISNLKNDPLDIVWQQLLDNIRVDDTLYNDIIEYGNTILDKHSPPKHIIYKHNMYDIRTVYNGDSSFPTIYVKLKEN